MNMKRFLCYFGIHAWAYDYSVSHATRSHRTGEALGGPRVTVHEVCVVCRKKKERRYHHERPTPKEISVLGTTYLTPLNNEPNGGVKYIDQQELHGP